MTATEDRDRSIDQSDDWDQHWEGFSDSASDNPAQHFRHRLVRQLVIDACPTRLLDIGSGQGDLLSLLQEACPRAVLLGVELSQVGVDATRAKVPRANVRRVDLLQADAEVSLIGLSADVATCCEVLEHLDDPVSFLTVARTGLVPGATLIVTVPGGPRSAFDRLIGHRRHYSPDDLSDLLTRAGFVVDQAWGAGFPFFNLYRWVVVARGEKLADDVNAAHRNWLATAVMKVFGVLFRLNRTRGQRGWQTMAVARVPR